jgi:hypothetical protein
MVADGGGGVVAREKAVRLLPEGQAGPARLPRRW